MMDLVTFRQMLRLHDWEYEQAVSRHDFARGAHQEMRIEEALGILHAQGLGEPAQELYRWWSGFRDSEEPVWLLERETGDEGQSEEQA